MYPAADRVVLMDGESSIPTSAAHLWFSLTVTSPNENVLPIGFTNVPQNHL